MNNFFKESKTRIFDFFKIFEKSTDPTLLNRVDNTRFVVLDTETTGFDFDNDRILCIGAVSLLNGVISIPDSFEIYIHQEYYDKNSAQIHGILKDWVMDKPSELEALQQFLAFVSDSVIVAHHTIFDITMINKALERNGLPQLTNKTLDTAFLYKKTLIMSNLLERKDKYALDDLADKFDISKKDRHTAMGDAYITAIAFLKIVKKLKGLKGKSEFTLGDLFKY
ncbi:3'-5' exonuclease [Flavobacterium gilvum]|uniref:DNA polymerase III subunit epsilon n=1 Tax=Flavobacterium gilvum TaxID=1492737 RepID=A0AAC9N6K8_9FLAO|nr:3'-5' exonuclease [Flavobacterium gilvum]AOW09779.1 DNA polymerase III subunit epsilon [Flavobacterium gilvum]KFC60360.1 DNA polymerase III subunit epsilon [Flavobacterium gilvum]